jgi:hypothetical protein
MANRKSWLSTLKLTEAGPLLMALQTHNGTGELVKDKAHILPLSAGNIRHPQI